MLALDTERNSAHEGILGTVSWTVLNEIHQGVRLLKGRRCNPPSAWRRRVPETFFYPT